MHTRHRQVLQKCLKRIKHFPIVALQGARQTGKSYFAREILQKNLAHSKYLTFDHQSILTNATERPHTFLEGFSDSRPLMIDEAQKVPTIFDAVKYEVDQNRLSGRFILLGSTEFSRLTKVRESLTGRMGGVRIYPMNLTETLEHHLKLKPTKKQLLTYLDRGGMPAIFSVNDESARIALFEDWVNLTCTRDILQFKTLKLDPEITYRVLLECARQSEPSKNVISRVLKLDHRRTETHLKALCELFVLQKLSAHQASRGKPIYLILDCGIASYLGASFERRLEILMMNERLCKNSYFNVKQKNFSFYKSARRNYIHWIEEDLNSAIIAIQILSQERIKKIDVELMRAFLTKNPTARGHILAPIPETMRINNIIVRPWEDILSL